MSGAAKDDLATGVSLDALFRSNAQSRPNAAALADPAGRGRYTDGAPRRLTYAEADAEIDRLARRLQSFGVAAGSPIALQLPNLVEAVISLLAVLRAGFTAVPMPMAWRRSDLVAALSRIEPKALLTLARFGDERPAEAACEAAAELFHLSFPCAFGAQVPDGIIALDLAESAEAAALRPASFGADAVAIATFDAAADGFFACGRGHSQWLAAGLATLLEAKIESGDTIATTIPPSSLAGIGAVLVPWLLSGGALELRDGISAGADAPTSGGRRTHLVAPAAAVVEMASRGGPVASCIAVQRGTQAARDLSSLGGAIAVDFLTFGELGAVALRRDDMRRPRPVPLGAISAPSASGGTPIVIETRLSGGELQVRGPMVPRGPFPAGARLPRMAADGSGFVHTGYACRADGRGGIVIDAGPARVATIGGLRFGLDDLNSRIASCVGAAKIEIVADALLGERLCIAVDDPAAAAAALQAGGHSSLVLEALVPIRRRATG